MNQQWDDRFLEMAKLISTWSKDPSTKCGAVITQDKRIISHGYNGFPKGVDDDPKLYANRERKYRRVIHAEQNAILHAKQDLTGCTCYVYPIPPCSTCAALLIQVGIKRIVAPKPSEELLERWGAGFVEAACMYADAGVELILVDNLFF